MSYSNGNGSSGGIGILGVLQIVFIVLKCVGVIDLGWEYVLIPLWIWLGIAALIVILSWLDV